MAVAVTRWAGEAGWRAGGLRERAGGRTIFFYNTAGVNEVQYLILK